MADFQKYHYTTMDEKRAAGFAKELVHALRKRDLLDCGTLDPFDLYYKSILYSAEYYVYRDSHGAMLCVAGVGYPADAGIGRNVWMVGTEKLMSYKKELLFKETKRLLDELLDRYGLLWNCVNVDNIVSMRWLRHFGAVFLPEVYECNGGIRERNFFIAKEVV